MLVLILRDGRCLVTSIKIRILPESSQRLTDWKEQQPSSKNGIYKCKIDHTIYNEYDDSLTIFVDPLVRAKDKYELNATIDCKFCGGHGWVRYQLDQDDIKSAPCHICFPETEKQSEWLRRQM